MKHIFTIFCISLFFYPLHMRSMEKEEQLPLPIEQCNENNFLLSLVKEGWFIDAISYFYKHVNKVDHYSGGLFINKIKHSIKFFMKLSCLSKEFNDYLTPEKIGFFCKVYSQRDRSDALTLVLAKDKLKYAAKRLPLLILFYANADVARGRNDRVFELAVKENDVPFAQLLFEKFPSSAPCFSDVRTLEIAQLYSKHNCFDTCSEIGCMGNGHPNYLWTMIDSEYPLELMEFCYKQGSCPRKLSIAWGNKNCCLLHGLAYAYLSGQIENQHDIDLFLKKAAFVLGLIPDMVNALNYKGETPLDKLYASVENLKDARNRVMNSAMNYCPANYVQIMENKISAYEQLIPLFWKYGAFTAQGLEQQK